MLSGLYWDIIKKCQIYPTPLFIC